MPYQSMEQVFSRKHERVAALFSVHNVLGIVAVALPVYIIGWLLPGWLHMGLTLLAAAAGYVLTMDRDGMALYERILWRLRAYAAPVLAGKRVLSPANLPGMQVKAAPRVMVHGGPVRVARGRRRKPQGALARQSQNSSTVRPVRHPSRPAILRPVQSEPAPETTTETNHELPGELARDGQPVEMMPDTSIAYEPAGLVLAGAEERQP